MDDDRTRPRPLRLFCWHAFDAGVVALESKTAVWDCVPAMARNASQILFVVLALERRPSLCIIDFFGGVVDTL